VLNPGIFKFLARC